MEKFVKDLGVFGKALKDVDVSWNVHLEADVIVDGMQLSIEFDKPIPQS